MTTTTEKETRNLKVKLIDAEIAVLGLELAHLSHDLAAQEDKRREATRDFKTEIDGLKKDMRDRVEAMTTGAADRPVECEWVRKYSEQIAELTRTDTGEVVETRSMSHEELQMSIDGAFVDEVEEGELEPKKKRRVAPGKNGK